MVDQEDEELKMALRMSMQTHPPEPKRSKPWEDATSGNKEPPVVENRMTQRELMAAAAEKRMMASRSVVAEPMVEKREKAMDMSSVAAVPMVEKRDLAMDDVGTTEKLAGKALNLVNELSVEEADRLFLILFGSEVSGGILAQWSNQGIRFSPDQETSMGLVQHEGGPCGVLAAIQAFVLKYLLFSPDKLSSGSKMSGLASSAATNESIALDDIMYSVSEETKSRALVRSLAEILFMCGSKKRAVIATLSVLEHGNEGLGEGNSEDEVIAKALEGLVIESGSDLQKVLRVDSYSSQASACQRLEAMLPVFRSRMGALLFLISALLSRGLDLVQDDRDDPSQSLVTAPFGHASQEIVNLLLSGQAVAHVFDGRMDLGGEMFLNGISGNVEVGFLTLLESLNFCKVGQYLKCPKWPIWVVGSESHYTVLFALEISVQNENEFEGRESLIRRAFDAQDQSGGGGFISVEGFHQILRETNINLPSDKLNHLTGSGFIVWSEFLQVLMDLDRNLGGLKDSTGLMGKKVFEIYHFNGIAKSDLNGGFIAFGSETPVQRPRLTKLRVTVPPRWTPEEFMTDVKLFSEVSSKDELTEISKPEPPQHAPLVDCIRTRWARATCNWIGDPPSIV